MWPDEDAAALQAVLWGCKSLLLHQLLSSFSTVSRIISVRINAKQYVELNCSHCGNSFSKEKKEYDRWIRKGKTNFYCGLGCHYKHREPESDAPFKLIFKHSRRNAVTRKHSFSLSVDYIKQLWEEQNGKCAYTGVPLVLPTYLYESSPRKASLDRIDSTRGYEEGNVEFVCVFVNLGKNGFTKQEVIELLNDFKNGPVTEKWCAYFASSDKRERYPPVSTNLAGSQCEFFGW